MTLTLELTPELEARLTQEADRHGLDAPAYVICLINNQLPDCTPEPALKTPRVLTGYGKFAHVPFSSYDHDRETQEEIDREERQHLERVGKLK